MNGIHSLSTLWGELNEPTRIVRICIIGWLPKVVEFGIDDLNGGGGVIYDDDLMRPPFEVLDFPILLVDK